MIPKEICHKYCSVKTAVKHKKYTDTWLKNNHPNSWPLQGPILAGTFGFVIKNYSLRNLGIQSEVKGLLICVVSGKTMI